MKRFQLGILLLSAISAAAQSIALPWSGHGHDAQHTGISKVASQPMEQIRWQMPVDLARKYSNGGGSLLIHYGSPLITRQNTLVVPGQDWAGRWFPGRSARCTRRCVEVDSADRLLVAGA